MDFRYASVFKRIGAYIIDFLVHILLVTPAVFISILFNIEGDFNELLLLLTVLCTADFIQLIIFRGRTLGKVIFKLRILDKNTLDIPKPSKLFIRVLLNIPIRELLGTLWFIYVGIGIVMSETNVHNQSLWDKLAGTIVADESKQRRFKSK